MAESHFQIAFPIPAGYRWQDFLTFYQRDKQQIAERTDNNLIEKATLIEGVPVKISMRRTDTALTVEFEADGSLPDKHTLMDTAERLLALKQPVVIFETQYCDHPEIGILIEKNAGLRIPQSISPWEAITWAVIGQQISVEAAVSIRRRLILVADKRHSSGLWCYPDPETVAAMSDQQLRQSGFSTTKASTIKRLARSNFCHFPHSTERVDVENIEKTLLAVKGIGPWTVNYTLLRGFSGLDGSLDGDVAVRRNLQKLLGLENKPDAKFTKDWLKQFTPWRALVAAHLWAVDKDKSF
ncbi:DNA-3-methyladenine glycosylase family protein [Veronia pacifica]|uniref:DNA-3-methyladenine glycosylase II n=1 Tax=Veronia pacifica TaxID=1080227 RepID=A0A1C3EPH6_9GAMM|nr:DNA-3-methyladenine glycosylase 2 [Veronia pacifica]ODA35126.1 hypothetical protein A8L45_05465 [Veronia pacifica]